MSAVKTSQGSALAGVAQLPGASSRKLEDGRFGLAQACAYSAGSSLVGAHMRGNLWMFLSHISVSLPLSLPPFLSL